MWAVQHVGPVGPGATIVQEAKPERPPEEKEKPKDAAASETRLDVMVRVAAVRALKVGEPKGNIEEPQVWLKAYTANTCQHHV